ncbi:MAG TPA: acetate--CoA ligase family protein [Pilimelia sp.]|nr:acetate--CoA ligase family protein [Pilimelia sp.]
MSRDLSPLFDPRSVAVVGASDDPSKYGNWIAERALRGGRPVYLVNRGRPTVLGRPAVAGLREIGEPVDLAVIAVPAAGFEAAVDDALAIGVRAIVGISAGLGESGAAGQARQTEIAARVRAAGACLLGPNCLGVLDHSTGLDLNSYDFPPGTVALLSQSGNVGIELAGLLADHGLGFSRFASLGNQADLDAADLIDACVAHEATAAIALYCEDFRDGRRFATAAWRAHAAGKPVVLLAVGRGAASARGARSHTGSLVSPGIVVEAACDAAGVELVATPAQLANLLQALLRTRPPRGRRVAVFADGGGQAQIASDAVETAGLAVPPFGAALADAVRAELPATANPANPVDVAGGGEQDIGCFSRVTAHLVASDEVDAVLMTGFFGGYGDYSAELGAGEVKAAHEITFAARDATLVVHTMNWRTPAADVLRAGGVPVYRTVEDAVWVLDRLAQRGGRAPRGVPEMPPASPPVAEAGYGAARRLLAGAGLPFVAAAEVTSLHDLLAAAGQMRYPLVLKALGEEHKSDLGGVVLDIPDAATLTAVWHDLRDRLRPPSCSVEEMAETSGAVELIIGVRRDARFGPVVMAGMGGVYTEVLRDVRCALAPVDHATARDLLLSLRGAPLLTGVRGRRPVDVDAAAGVVVTLSRVAATHPEIAEIECNPVAVASGGAVCLDARVVLVPARPS